MMKTKKMGEYLEAAVIGLGITTVIWNDIVAAGGLIVVYILALYIQLTWTKKSEDIAYHYDLIHRPESSNGILLGSTLIPLSILSSQAHHNSTTTQQTHQDLATPSIIFSLACLVCVCVTRCRLSVKVLEWLVSVRLVVVWLLVMIVVERQPVAFAGYLVVFLVGPVTCVWYFLGLLYVLEESFTIGEAMIVAQGLTHLTIEAVNISTYQQEKRLIACLQVLILGGIIIGLTMKPLLKKMTTVYSTNTSRSRHKGPHGNGAVHSSRIQDIPNPFSWKLTVYFYIAMVATIVCVLIPWLGWMIDEWPFWFALEFIFFTSDKRTLLVILWALLITVAITMVFCLQTSSTVTRKYFHLFTVAAFLPGIYLDVQLFFLATAGTFFIAILLEFLRIHQVWPLGGTLQSASKTLGDAQDTGVMFLSHVYLLLGLAVPVWLYTGFHGFQIESNLALFSGVLSLGIGDTAASVIGSQCGRIQWPGDTAASVIGSQCGRIQWPGTNKTVEGTLASILTQIGACYVLSYIGILPSMASHCLYISWTIILTSLLEAFTSQIDNLVLPLFMYCLLLIRVT